MEVSKLVALVFPNYTTSSEASALLFLPIHYLHLCKIIKYMRWRGLFKIIVNISYSSHKSDMILKYHAAAAAKLLQPCLTLCDPIDDCPPGSSVPGILQARILEWLAISFSNACMHAKSCQSCLTLWDPMDSSPWGSSVHRIL